MPDESRTVTRRGRPRAHRQPCRGGRTEEAGSSNQTALQSGRDSVPQSLASASRIVSPRPPSSDGSRLTGRSSGLSLTISTRRASAFARHPDLKGALRVNDGNSLQARLLAAPPHSRRPQRWQPHRARTFGLPAHSPVEARNCAAPASLLPSSRVRPSYPKDRSQKRSSAMCRSPSPA